MGWFNSKTFRSDPAVSGAALDAAARGLTLYHFNTCPFCLRVRWALDRLGLEIPLRNIRSDPGAREELLAGGGRTMVPCLRIEADGETRWLYESDDIIDFLRQRVAT